MAKKIIKDIQIKKKIPVVSKKEEILDLPQVLPEKEVPVLKERVIKRKRKSSWRPIFYIVLILGLISLILYAVYNVSTATVSVTLLESQKDINESVTLSSWNNPIKSTVMSVQKEEVVSSDSDMEKIKQEISKKIDNGFYYDLPQNYILIPGCKTDIKYSEVKTEGELPKTFIVSSSSALVMLKKDLENYILKQMRVENTTMKDISKLSCELKTDITPYKNGDPTGNLSFIIKGEVTTKPVVTEEHLKSLIAGKSVKKAEVALSQDKRIAGHKLKVSPFKFFPYINNHSEKIKIIYEN